MLVALVLALLVSNAAFAWALFVQRRRFRARMAEAELRRLRNQLNPHFLFNSLNAIAELGYDEPAAADRAITQLSGLLRKSLDENHGPEISLKAEIDFLENYLALQRLLTRDALDIAVTVDPQALHGRVPTMILQPLVENALIHGARPGHAGRIAIAIARRGSNLEIAVRDDGPGLTARARNTGRPGIGIANTRARLHHLYGHAASLSLDNAEDGGTVARLVIPFHEAP